MRRFQSIIVAAILSLTAAAAVAQQFKGGDITIDKPWSRATPKGATVGVGYLVIRNHGASADKLTGGSADFAGEVTVHETTMDHGVTRMREMKVGLEIPANGQVALAPAGYHLMFSDLKRPLRNGETLKATLQFAHAGAVPVEFRVGGFGAAGPGGASQTPDSMGGMKM